MAPQFVSEKEKVEKEAGERGWVGGALRVNSGK